MLPSSSLHVSLEQLLSSTVLGQRRTANWKQFVLIYQDVVWKGPFERSKVDLIVNRSLLMKRWNTPYVVHPVSEIVTPSGIWLVFPNIASGYPFTTQLNKESFSNYSYQILDQAVVQPANKLLEHNPWVATKELLLALVHLYILGVGDSTLRNILVDPRAQKIYVTDYDETRSSNDPKGSFFYFKTPPGKKHSWYERVNIHHEWVIEQLILLQSQASAYAKDIQESITLLQNKGVWAGMFGGSVTGSGFQLDQMKSALQKYIRRGDEVKAVMCYNELWQLGLIAPAVKTNLLNRLRIIAGEDISIANCPLVYAVIYYLSLEAAVEAQYPIGLHLTRLMAQSPKTRVCSHLWYCYTNPIPLTVFVTPRVTLNDQELQWLQGRPHHYILDYHLQNKCFLAVTWTHIIASMPNVSGKKLSGRRTTSPASIIFEIMSRYLQREFLLLLEDCYYNQKKEGRVFLMIGIATILTGLPSPQLPNITQLSPLQLPDKLILDDYVVDKHTKQGRINGMGTSQFVTEGAIVNNEDPRWVLPELVHHYTQRR